MESTADKKAKRGKRISFCGGYSSSDESDEDELNETTSSSRAARPPLSKPPATTTTVEAVSFRNLTDVIENALQSSLRDLDNSLSISSDHNDNGMMMEKSTSFSSLEEVIDRAKRISIRELNYQEGGDTKATAATKTSTDANNANATSAISSDTAAMQEGSSSYVGESFSNLQHVIEQAKTASLKEMNYQASYSNNQDWDFESFRCVIII